VISSKREKIIVLKTLIIVLPLFFSIITIPDYSMAKKNRTSQKHTQSDQEILQDQIANQNIKCGPNSGIQISCSNINSQNAINFGGNKLINNDLSKTTNKGFEDNDNSFDQEILQDQIANQNIKCGPNSGIQISCSNINSQNAINFGGNSIE
jgi:hypothetical protein